MGFQPKYLGHVNIFVRNVERSHRWYADVLGLHTYGLRPGQVAFLSADLDQSHEVALVQAGDDALPPQARHVGLNHMAWMMSSLDDLKELYQRLKDRCVPIKRVSDHGISIGIYFEDLDGNGVEVSYETNGPARSGCLRTTSSNLVISPVPGTKIADFQGHPDNPELRRGGS
jgi:catechol 2,3-dioxygenase